MEDAKDTLQNKPNEGCEMNAAFKQSFKLKRPSTELDDVAAEICSLLTEKHLSCSQIAEENRHKRLFFW